LGHPVSSTNKTDRHDITELLLKVALSTTKPNQTKTKLLKLLSIFLFLWHNEKCWTNIMFIFANQILTLNANLIAFSLEDKYSNNCLMTNMLVTCSNIFQF
jgi:hypothetical protein